MVVWHARRAARVWYFEPRCIAHGRGAGMQQRAWLWQQARLEPIIRAAKVLVRFVDVRRAIVASCKFHTDGLAQSHLQQARLLCRNGALVVDCVPSMQWYTLVCAPGRNIVNALVHGHKHSVRAALLSCPAFEWYASAAHSWPCSAFASPGACCMRVLSVLRLLQHPRAVSPRSCGGGDVCVMQLGAAHVVRLCCLLSGSSPDCLQRLHCVVEMMHAYVHLYISQASPYNLRHTGQGCFNSACDGAPSSQGPAAGPAHEPMSQGRENCATVQCYGGTQQVSIW